jgi:hypothetical protein
MDCQTGKVRALATDIIIIIMFKRGWLGVLPVP